MVCQKGFEPLTLALEGRCSIQLSYWHIILTTPRYLLKMERVMGIGPTQPAWKAGTLPLSYTRIYTPHMPKNNSTLFASCQLFLRAIEIIFGKTSPFSAYTSAYDGEEKRGSAILPGLITVTPLMFSETASCVCPHSTQSHPRSFAA